MTTETLVVSNSGPDWSRRAKLAGGVLLSALVLAAMAFKIFQPVQVLPRIRLAPGFALIDQDGQQVTNEDLRGQVTLYSFVYTRCPLETCGAANQVMAEIQRQRGQIDLGGAPLRLMTISVDSQRDTPETLKAYAARQGADPQVWRFAVAKDPRLLKTIVGGGFEVYYQSLDSGEIRLDPAFILVDGWGIIRGEYRYATLSSDTERILRHLNVLGDEIKNSTGASRLAYEAAHLFLCYSH